LTYTPRLDAQTHRRTDAQTHSGEQVPVTR